MIFLARAALETNVGEVPMIGGGSGVSYGVQ
jgi:hypothetical protein